MERSHIDLIVRMFWAAEAILRLEGLESGDAFCGKARPLLLDIKKMATEAPPGLKSMRPSFGWDALSSMIIGDERAIRQAVRELIPCIGGAALSEFGLEQGTLVFFGMADASHATIFDTEIEGKPARCLFLDGVLSSAEFIDGSPALLYPPLIMRSSELIKSPRRGLVLGVAGGTMVEILKREYPHMHVDGADIDGAVMELGKRYFSLKEDGRTSLHICDAREFVRNSPEKYDFVVMDAFAGISPIPHLATVEFAREIKGKMHGGGVCAINIIARLERAGYLQHAFDTWRTVFGSVFVLPLCREGEVFNIVLIATDADARAFEERNRDAIYTMDFDPSRVLSDNDNRIRELSPY